MEEQGKIITVGEMVQLVINELSAIHVPAGLTATIGVPIYRSIQNLQKCQIAWAQEAAEAARKAQEEARQQQIELDLPEGADEPEIVLEALEPEPGMEMIRPAKREVDGDAG